MKAKIILSVLLWLFIQRAISDKCYEDNAKDPKFHWTPGGKTENDDSTPEESCKNQCIQTSIDYPFLEIKYAGFRNKDVCFCTSQSIEPDSLQDCSSEFGGSIINKSAVELKIFEIETLPALDSANDIDVSLRDDKKTVEMQIKNLPSDARVVFDYGDGSAMCNSSTHEYVVPGTYTIGIYITNTDNTVKQVNYRSIDIEQEMSKDMILNCMEKGEIDALVNYELKIDQGSSMSLNTEIKRNGEKQELTEEQLPDTSTIAYGPAIPQDGTWADIGASNFPSQWIMLTDSMISSEGKLTGFEFYGTGDDTIQITVLQPKPEDKYCLPNELPCDTYYSLAPYCIDPKEMKFEIKQTLDDIQCTQGYQYHPLSETQQVVLTPGDILSIKTTKGKLGTRNQEADEMPDYSGDTADVIKTDTKQIHLFRAIVATPLELTFDKTFDQPGTYEIDITVASNSNSVTKTCTIKISSEVPDFDFKIEPEKGEVGDDFTFAVTIDSGNDVTIQWLINGEEKYKEIKAGEISQEEFIKNHQFPEEGEYEVTVIVSNELGEFNKTKKITIQNSLEESQWEFTSNQPVTIPPGEVEFSLNYKGSKTYKNLNAVYRWGENENNPDEYMKQMEILSTETTVVLHTYSKIGDFIANVNVSNAVSSITLETPVTVTEEEETVQEEKIDILVTPYYDRHKDGNYIEGYAPQKHYFPANYTIKLDTIIEGTVSKVFIDWGIEAGYQEYPIDVDYLHLYSQVGDYRLLAYGTNDNQKTKLKRIKLVIQAGLEGINDFGTISDYNQTKVIQIDYADPSKCAFVDFGDGSSEKYGPKEVCDTQYPDAKYQGEVDQLPFNVTHKYTSRNYYTMKLVTYNEAEIDPEQNATFLINDFPYHPKPSVIIRVNSTDFRKPVQFRCGDGRKLETMAYLPHLHRSTYQYNASWDIVKVDPTTGMELPLEPDLPTDENSSFLSNCPQISRNKTFLFIEPRCLKYGLYKITYYYNATVEEMTQDYPIMCNTYTYVESVKSDLHPGIIPNDYYEVTRTWGDPLTLTVLESSLDPDDFENKNFTVKWYCRKLGKANSQSDPIEGIGINLKMYLSDRTSDECFANGGDSVIMENQSWVLNTSSLVESDHLYLIAGVVFKDTRNGTAMVILNVVSHPAPILQLECSLPALCHAILQGHAVNPNLRLSLRVLCVENCKELYDYQWKVLKFDDVDEVLGSEMKEAKQFIVGTGEQLMALTLEFFTTFDELKVIAVMATATKPNDKTKEPVATIALKFIINQPPINGECAISVPGTYALIDQYQVECNGWEDPENYGVSNYKIYSVDKRGTKLVLTTTKDNWIVLILPPGRMSLYADVIDFIGSKTTTTIAINITVKIITKQQFDDYVLNKQVDYMRCTGNQFQYMQSLQALGVTAQKLFGRKLHDVVNPAHEAQLQQIMSDSLKRLDELNCDSFNDAELMASTVSSIVGDGTFLDREGKNSTLNILDEIYDKINTPNNTITFLTPVQASNFYSHTFSALGAVSKSLSNTVVHKVISPNDMKHADELEYDTSIDITDPNFAVATSVDEARARSVTDDAQYQSKFQTERMNNIVDDAVISVIKNFVPGEAPLIINTPNDVSAFFISVRGKDSENISQNVGDATFQLPNFCDLINNKSQCDDTVPFAVSLITWPTLTNVYDKSVSNLAKNSKVADLNLFTGDLNSDRPLPITNSSVPILITVPRYPMDDNSHLPPVNDSIVVPKMKWFEDMMYHQVQVKKKETSLNYRFNTEAYESIYVIFMSYDIKPTLEKFEYKWIVNFSESTEVDNAFRVFITSDQLKNRIGHFYLGVTQLADNVTENQVITQNTNISKSTINRNWNDTYTMITLTANCWFFDDFYKVWKNSGCKVRDTTLMETQCECTHLTPFGTGLVVPPNPIDFTYVFANANFVDNLTIYVTILVTIVFFVIFLIWARCKDKRDIEKLGALPLPDNNPNDKYLYEVLVFTNDVKGASCESKISFILTGENEETEVRTFGCPPRKAFKRNGVDIFVMSVPRPLGQLQFLRIWHDNSGKDDLASWSLNYVIFHDIQTGEKFEFIAGCWLALEKDDGLIDRSFAVADKEQLSEFGHLFATTSRKKLTDGHIWFSVFFRPPRSRFTRCQRVACCAALLFLSMLVNAMWYGTVPEKTSSGMKFGPFQMSPEQIAIGFFSNLIIFPPSFLIVYIFRKARPRKLRPSRVNEALRKQETDNVYGQGTSQSTSKQTGTKRKFLDKLVNPLKYKRKKKFTLPWWFVIIGWILCAACIGASIFFLWAYGIQFGNDKTKKWVTSLVVSFFASIFLTQPLKVFFLAMLFSAICKKVETDEDDADEDEEDPHLNPDEQWIVNNDPTKPKKIAYKMRNQDDVEKAKQTRIKEVRTFNILKEIFGYLFYLWILAIIGFGLVDPNGIRMYKTLMRGFVKLDKDDGFMEVQDIEDYWIWTQNVMIPNLRAGRNYNGDPPYSMKGFLNDGVNRIMGYGIIRQLRLKPGECTTARIADQYFNCTGVHTNTLDEDTTDYGPGWLNKTKIAVSRFEKAFIYTSAEDLQGFPIVGNLDVYEAGGYVYEMDANRDEIQKDFTELEDYAWIDEYTTAVFIEFSVYNAQVNLFGIVSLFIEFGSGGSVFPDYNVEAIQLLQYQGPSGLFIFICCIIFVLFTLYFTLTELLQFCKLGCRYFQQPGLAINWLIIILSYTDIAFGILRHIAVREALDYFQETKYNKYINLQRCQYLNEIFCTTLALIIFLSILKFMRLLRFNKRMSMLADTLQQCASDLKGFSVVMLVFYLAYAQAFFLIFFKQNYEYSTTLETIVSLVSVSLNRFEFKDYVTTESCIGPIVFFSFTFMMSFFMINIFLTLVIKSFESIKHDLSKQNNEYEIVSFIMSRFKSLMGRNSRQRLPTSLAPTFEIEDDSHATTEFPEKVDRLLQHINSVYFDGRLNLRSKSMFYGRKQFNHQAYGEREVGHVFNSDT